MIINVKGTLGARQQQQQRKTNTMKSVTATSTPATSTRGPGRPRKSIKLILSKSFSLKDLASLNPGVNKLTIRQHVLRGVESGQFTKLTKTVQTGTKGKPAHLFINTKVYNTYRRAKANIDKARAHQATEKAAATVAA